jgi:two-component system sensor histidine kinase HydH
VTLDATRGSDSVTLTVRDTGDGIAPGELEEIFAPFWTSRPDGTGLGLAVSRRIVESHGGTLSAASVVGHGATFTVRLPLTPL